MVPGKKLTGFVGVVLEPPLFLSSPNQIGANQGSPRIILFTEYQVLLAKVTTEATLEKRGVSPASRRAAAVGSQNFCLMSEAVFLDFLVKRGSVDAENPGDVGEVAAFVGQKLGDMLALQFLQG